MRSCESLFGTRRAGRAPPAAAWVVPPAARKRAAGGNFAVCGFGTSKKHKKVNKLLTNQGGGYNRRDKKYKESFADEEMV